MKYNKQLTFCAKINVEINQHKNGQKRMLTADDRFKA